MELSIDMINEDVGKIHKEYANRAQLEFMVVNPKLAYVRWGRGTGKTEGPIAFRTFNAIRNMPRSCGAFVTPSYQKFYTDLVPGLKLGLERFKMYEDIHYVVGKEPPKNKNWDEPIYKPKNYNNVIAFANGSIIKLSSQDSKVSGQGNCYDYVIADECKLLDKKRINEEILKAMRGNGNRFKNVQEYASQLYVSDKFVKGKNHTWIFKNPKGYDPEVMATLKKMVDYYFYLKANGKPTDSILADIHEISAVYPYVSEASSVDNAHALGIEFFKLNADSSTPLELLVSLFNEDHNSTENGFYFLLDEYVHGYSSSNVDYLHGIGFGGAPLNCLKDGDINYSLPLELNFDFGGIRNFCTVTQYDVKPNVFSLLKDFMEMKYEQICDAVDTYYAPFKAKNKRVILYNDPVGNKQQPNSYTTYMDDIFNALKRRGWQPEFGSKSNAYIGHDIKFNIWKKVLDTSKDRDPRFPTFRFNKDNAHRAFVSMARAMQKETGGRIEKDKSDEKNLSKDQQYTTHFSDTLDYNVCRRFEHLEYGMAPIHVL